MITAKAEIVVWGNETDRPAEPKTPQVEQRPPVLYTADERPIYRAVGFVGPRERR